MNYKSDKVIVIISPESWGNIFVSKHHYAQYLSKNHKVYFIEPPRGINFFLKDFQFVHSTHINSNLVKITYSNIIPSLTSFPSIIQNIIYSIQAFIIRKYIIRKDIDIVWNFDPFRFWNFKGFNAKKNIYHKMDMHPNAKQEDVLSNKADLLISVSPHILNTNQKSHPNLLIIPHGLAINENKETSSTINIPGTNKIKSILLGNFIKKIDYSLIETLATENKDCDFILIGPYRKNNLTQDGTFDDSIIDKLKKHKNIYFTGEIPHYEIIDYLKKGDINLALYNEKVSTARFNSHKLMEYFYSGKVTITSFFKDYENESNELIINCRDNTTILSSFKKVKESLDYFNSPALQEKRRTYAEGHAYPILINQIINYLS